MMVMNRERVMTMKDRYRTAGLLALAWLAGALGGPSSVLGASPAEAPPARAPMRASPAAPDEALPTDGDIGAVQKRIADLRAWRMADELGFDEKTNARLFAVLRDSDGKRIRIESDNRQAIALLRDLLRSPAPDSRKIAATLDRLAENQRQQRAMEEEHLRRVREVLDPVQTARYLFFELHFQREIRERVTLTVRERRGRMDEHGATQ
jgi:Spy/CpxP family protein refolding chaperone